MAIEAPRIRSTLLRAFRGKGKNQNESNTKLRYDIPKQIIK